MARVKNEATEQPDGISSISVDVPPAEAEAEERPRERESIDLSEDNLSPYRQMVIGVDTQRPYKKLSDIDLTMFPFIGEVSVDGDLVTIERADRDTALNAASNVIAVVPGGWEMASSYAFGEDDDPQWRVVLRRKE